jgi:hypothetical protein
LSRKKMLIPLFFCAKRIEVDEFLRRGESWQTVFGRMEINAACA